MVFTWLGIQICIYWLQIHLTNKVGVWIIKPVSIWSDTSPSHRVDQAVDYGLWNVVPLLFNGCEKLLDIGGNLNMLSYMSIQSIPSMLNGWHIIQVCRAWKNWDIFSFQELCTGPSDTVLCIIIQKHEVMEADEWLHNGTQDLVTVSLHIKLPSIKCNCVCCP